MNSNNWRAVRAEPQLPPMDFDDWRSTLPPYARQRIVNKLTETFKRNIPLSDQEVVQEHKQIAIIFEEKIYTAATSQSDYLGKISLKMLLLESKPRSVLPCQPPAARAEPHLPRMDSADWRSQLPSDVRQRIVHKITETLKSRTETLKRHLPLSGQGGVEDHKQTAIRFEEKIYSSATSQSDYLRKISVKMLLMESKSQMALPSDMPSNSTGRNPQPPGEGQ